MTVMGFDMFSEKCIAEFCISDGSKVGGVTEILANVYNTGMCFWNFR